MSSNGKKLFYFVLGTLFGSAGFKLLASQDAKKAYVQVTAAGLRMKDCLMETVTNVQENVGDIVAEAKDLNEARAAVVAKEDFVETEADAEAEA